MPDAMSSTRPVAEGGTPLLEISDLHVDIPTARGVVKAVDGVSLRIERGETVGIVGESGCGKSMMALSVLGLVPQPGRITSGSISLDGRDLVGLSERSMRQIRGKDVGMIFQDPSAALNPTMRVGAQVGETIRAHGLSTAATARARTLDLLRGVQIPAPERRMNAYPHQFSGGMRQRVMIAMGMANSPSLIIADEPTTALDVTVQAQVIELLRQMNSETGTSILLITHNIALLARFCRRMVVMYAGQVVEEGPTRRVLDSPSHPYTAALIASVPRVEQQRGKMATIDGRPPDLARKPHGCAFYSRCPYGAPKCTAEMPAMIETGPGQVARCWFPLGNPQVERAEN